MRLRYPVLSLLIMIVATAFAQNANDGFYFTNYKVDVTVNDDNTLRIVEDIDAVFTEERHGLKRYVPVQPYVKRDVSERQDGSAWAIKHYDVDVEDVKVSEDYDVSEDDSEVYEIRIGSADKTVVGPHHYTLSYTLHLPWDRVTQADIFYYSVLGSAWNCDVQNFSFDIHFKKPVPQASLAALAVFAGETGDSLNRRDAIVTKATTSEICGKVSDLAPFNAVTVRMPLPEGYYTYSFCRDKVVWALVAVAVLLLLYVLYRELFKSEKVMRVMTVVPPKDLSSAEVGTLFDCSVDDCDLISLIPWFASHGYLAIDNTGKYPVLTKLKNLPAKVPAYQQKLFSGMFDGGQKKFDTGKKTGKKFGKAWLEAKKALQDSHKEKLDDINMPMVVLYAVALLTASVAVCLSMPTDGEVMGAVTTGVFGIIAFVMVVTSSMMRSWGVKAFCFLVDSTLLLAWGYAMWACSPDDDFYLQMDPVYSMVALLAIVSLFAGRMVFMTAYRRERMGEILGLEEFIRLSEEPQLRQLQADEERYFYDVLPFAVAFGMSELWAKKFRNITVPPNECFNNGDNDLNSMSSSLASEVSSPAFASGIKAESDARAAAARAASSSGSSHNSASSFSGGGYSGGGFGGGGGTSW